MNQYEQAKNAYASIGIDTDAAIAALAEKPVSIHCWQGDDVTGFDNGGAGGGIQATGNYPGKARDFEELKADFKKACSLIPGKKRINIHASYAVFADGKRVERNLIEFKHFTPWVDFARDNGIGIDFNPTCFGHPLVKDGLTLSSPDETIRNFWVEHCRRSRQIANAVGEALNDYVLCNLWIPDGFKDIPADRLSPRLRLKQSLDEIYAQRMPHIIDSVESKVFGIGLESYTVGSNEFYLAYASGRPGIYNLLDNGHYHPTESAADKIPSLLCFFDKIPLHITRPVRWDSDHVILYDDETRELCKEIVRNNALDKILIGLDFFDASINRIAAWVIGSRSVQKGLLYALLMPHDKLKAAQNAGNHTEQLVIMEDIKTLPFGAVWAEYCRKQNVPLDGQWMEAVREYEQNVLLKRR